MPRVYSDPYHHFELSADGKTYKCAHCAAAYDVVPDPVNGNTFHGAPSTYQLHHVLHPQHAEATLMQEHCSGKANGAAV
jgi:hypothetical protein